MKYPKLIGSRKTAYRLYLGSIKPNSEYQENRKRSTVFNVVKKKAKMQYGTPTERARQFLQGVAGLGVLRRSKRQADYLREYSMEYGVVFDKS